MKNEEAKDDKEDENEDPLADEPVFEPRQLTSTQRIEIKKLVNQLVKKRSGWLLDQRSILFEGPTNSSAWTSLSKDNVVMRQFVQIVLRPEVKSGNFVGLILYHRYIRKPADHAADRRNVNKKIEDDGVAKLIREQPSAVATRWVVTAWRDSAVAKELKKLFDEISAEDNEKIKKGAAEENDKPKYVTKTPF